MKKLIHMEVKSLSEKQLVGAGARITQGYPGSWPLYYTLQPQPHCSQSTHLSSQTPLWTPKVWKN